MTRGRELWLSLIAIGLITFMYLGVVFLFGEIPGASDLFGHSLGILGFLLMLAAETLYSFRKRSRSARWGRMSAWLQFHIFTGLVGPYLVLLHSSWKFNGLAGIVMWLTVIIVVSGFIGRYIYTLVPRGLDGAEIEANVLDQEIKTANEELTRWLDGRPQTILALADKMAVIPGEGNEGLIALLSRPFSVLRYRWRFWWLRKKMDSTTRKQALQLEALLRHQAVLNRQLASLAFVRRLLGLWYIVHIPVGLSLFVAAFIHIVAAVYYATLLR